MKELTPINAQSLNVLERIYQEFYEKEGGDPWERCQYTTVSVLNALGYPKVDGHFLLDIPYKSRGRYWYIRPHSWNEAPDDPWWNGGKDPSLVDLVAHQFNSELQVPLNDGVTIVVPGSPLYERYLPRGINVKDYCERRKLKYWHFFG